MVIFVVAILDKMSVESKLLVETRASLFLCTIFNIVDPFNFPRFNFVHDLVMYLYKNNLQKYIEIYVQKVRAMICLGD